MQIDKLSQVCGAILALLLLISAAFAFDARADDIPAEAVTNSKLDNIQSTLDVIAQELTPSEDAAESTPAPDYTETLQRISDQLADLQETANLATQEEVMQNPFEKPFAEYDLKETLLLIVAFILFVMVVFWFLTNFIL